MYMSIPAWIALYLFVLLICGLMSYAFFGGPHAYKPDEHHE